MPVQVYDVPKVFILTKRLHADIIISHFPSCCSFLNEKFHNLLDSDNQLTKYSYSEKKQTVRLLLSHDYVIKWKHFPRYWPFVRRIHQWPVNSPHKGQWRGASMFSLICAWINAWINMRLVIWDAIAYHDYLPKITILASMFVTCQNFLASMFVCRFVTCQNFEEICKYVRLSVCLSVC